MRSNRPARRVLVLTGLVALAGTTMIGCVDNKSPAMRAWERSTTANRPPSGQYMTASDAFGRMAFTPITTESTVANVPTE